MIAYLFIALAFTSSALAAPKPPPKTKAPMVVVKPPPVAFTSLIGTWSGFCQQFAGYADALDTATCIPYKSAPLFYNYSITYNSDMTFTYVEGAGSRVVGKTTFVYPGGSGSGKLASKTGSFANGCITSPSGNTFFVKVKGNTYQEFAKISFNDVSLDGCKDPKITTGIFCIPKAFYTYTCTTTKVM